MAAEINEAEIVLREMRISPMEGSVMTSNIIDQVALALFASDGMKFASAAIDLKQSWDLSPEQHVVYRERALVFLKVMGEQMSGLADTEIAQLAERERQ
ncbi:MAG: hypothetical protein ACPW61_13385 [Methyloligella sp. ZOD6]